MGALLAFLGTGKGTWLEVHKILEQRAFETTILFIDDWAARDYKNEFQANLVVIPGDANAPTDALIAIMHKAIHDHVHGELDLAVNLASGTGRAHAALITAIMQSGLGMRLVTFEDGQLKVLL